MDSDDDFDSANFSARDSQKDAAEVFTVIKKDQNRVSPSAKRQAEQKEKEL